MTIVLEHFCVGKFLQGQYLGGSYSVLASSKGVSIDLVRKATRVDLFGREPIASDGGVFRGYAFFRIDGNTFAVVMYQRSGLKEENRPHPIFKHYILMTTEDLKDIHYEIDRYLSPLFFTSEVRTNTKLQKEPLVVEVSKHRGFSKIDDHERELLFKGICTVIDNPNGIYKYPESSAEDKLRLASLWMQLVPVSVANFLTFTTTASAKLQNFRICFLGDESAQATDTLNLGELNQLHKNNRLNLSYLQWLTDAQNSPNEFAEHLEKLRLPGLGTDKDLGEILELASQFYYWNIDSESDPNIIIANGQRYKDLLSSTEQKKLVLNLALSYFKNNNFPGFVKVLKENRNIFVEDSVMTMLVKNLPSALSREFIEIGMSDGRARDIYLKIIEKKLELSFLAMDEESSFKTINNLIELRRNDLWFHTLSEQFLKLSDHNFKQAMTALLETTGSYKSLVYIDAEFNQNLEKIFPELWQFIKNVKLYEELGPQYVEVPGSLEILLNCFEDGQKFVWASYCVEYIAQRKCWLLLTDLTIQTALHARKHSNALYAAWARSWQVFRQNIEELRNFNIQTKNMLAEWAITLKDCEIALPILGLIHISLPINSTNFWKLDPKKKKYLTACDIDVVTAPPPKFLKDVEQWCSLYTSAQFLNLQGIINVSGSPIFSLIDAFLELQSRIKYSREVLDGRILPETRLQIYLMLLRRLHELPTDGKHSSKLTDKLTNEPLLMHMIDIIMASRECSYYILQFRYYLPDIDALNQYLDALHKWALRVNLNEMYYLACVESDDKRQQKMIFEKFVLENAILSHNAMQPNHEHVNVMLMFLNDLNEILDRDPSLVRFCNSWLPIALNSDDYYHSIREVAGLQREQLINYCKKINIKLSQIKLKSIKRFLKQLNIQLFDFTGNMIKSLEHLEN